MSNNCHYVAFEMRSFMPVSMAMQAMPLSAATLPCALPLRELRRATEACTCLHSASSTIPIRSSSCRLRTQSSLRSRIGSFSTSVPPLAASVYAKRGGVPVVRAASENGGEGDPEKAFNIVGISLSRKDLQIAAGAALVVAFSVANRVLYKMALVPMKDYPFFLALFNTFGYVLVYFSILYARYRTHIVTDEMLKLPKSRFIAVGFLEAVGLASGMTAAAVLPGASIPVLSQTFLIWQLIFSIIFLRRRYSFNQVVGCSLVLFGVLLALTSTSSGFSFSADRGGLFWPFVMIVSASFQAGASIIKEFLFRDAAERLQSKSLDIFVVNSFGSGFQSLFVFLLLPFLSQVKGIPLSQLPSYIKDGAGCLTNIGIQKPECQSAPLVALCYILINLAFNISLLSLVKSSSAVVASLCTTLAVPLSIYMFTLPLPFVGVPASLPAQFLVGTAVLISGLAVYNFADRIRTQLEKSS